MKKDNNFTITTIDQVIEVALMDICPWSMKLLDELKRQRENGAELVKEWKGKKENFEFLCIEFYDINGNFLDIKIF
ncbi:MAG: hypothetical protein IJH34_07635 [Romboutsia sp.]|nr:hypothetical protein [Romboutsia sp.]